MIQRIALPSFLPLITGVLAFAAAMELSYYVMQIVLKTKHGLALAPDYFETIEMLGYIAGALAITQLASAARPKYALIYSLLLLLLAISTAAITSNYEVLWCCMFIIGAAKFSYFAVSFNQLLLCFNCAKIQSSITIFMATVMLGYIGGKLLVDSINSSSVSNLSLIQFFDLFIINIITITLAIIPTLLYKSPATKQFAGINIKFSRLVETMELEALTGFIIAYVMMAVYWEYDIFAASRGFVIQNVESVKQYMLFGVLIVLFPIGLLLRYVSSYFMTFISSNLVMICCILVPIFGFSLVASVILFSAISAGLYIMFVGSIISLANKFEHNNFNTSLRVYFTMIAVGAYSGVMTSDNISVGFGNNTLLVSLGSALVIYNAYAAYNRYYKT